MSAGRIGAPANLPARLIRSMLYGTAPYAPAVIAAVILVLLSIASIACVFPAVRASRLDPMHALRTE